MVGKRRLDTVKTTGEQSKECQWNPVAPFQTTCISIATPIARQLLQCQSFGKSRTDFDTSISAQ
jgi:hypothetical protein